jgi:hypothetical protein
VLDSGKKPSSGDKKAGDDHGAGGSKPVVVERMIKEVGMAAAYPELTRTNFNEWALVMQVNFEAQGLWEATVDDDVDRRDDRQALAVMLRAVPAEMRSTLAVKKSAKEAWEAVRTMQLGMDCVKAAKSYWQSSRPSSSSRARPSTSSPCGSTASPAPSAHWESPWTSRAS